MGSELIVKEVMTPDPLTVRDEDSATKARSLFRRYGYRGLPVVSRTGELAGIITDKDILKITSARSNILVDGLMSAPLVLATEDDGVSELAKKMLKADVEVCLVVDKNKKKRLVGLVSTHDIIRGFVERGNKPKRKLVEDIMSKDVAVCSPGDEISKIWTMTEKRGFTGLPVMKGKRLVGMITRSDVIKSGFARIEREDEKGSSKRSLVVEKIMRTPAVTIAPDIEVQEAAKILIKQRIGRLPVVKKAGKTGDVLAGILDRTDILKTYI